MLSKLSYLIDGLLNGILKVFIENFYLPFERGVGSYEIKIYQRN